jgi:hypothetical protein
MRIRLTATGDDDALITLGRWLSQDDAFRDRVRLQRAPVQPGTMGAVVDAVVVEVGLAIAALTLELVAWLRRRGGTVEIEASAVDGTTVRVRAADVRALDAEGIHRLANDLATRLTGSPRAQVAPAPERLNNDSTVTAPDNRGWSGPARKQIFISYVREDSATVQRLVTALTGHGFEPWWDQDDLLAGQRWKSVIRAQIRSCDYFIACFLPQYFAKANSYMNEELITAVERFRSMPRRAR